MKISKKGEYYGKQEKVLAQNGFLLSEYDYLDSGTPWHFHENPYFMFVLNGDMLDINKKSTTLCPAGSLVFHNWQDQHLNTRESDLARGFHIELDREWYKNKQLDFNLWEGSRLIKNPKLYHVLAKLYYEFKNNDAYSPLAIELLLLKLCEGIEKENLVKTKHEPLWVKDLRELLNENDESLSLTGLSKELGVHPVHLSRSIPKYLTTNLGGYLRQQKLKKAIPYILNKKYSLTEVAYLSGFADQSHFTRTFKKTFFMTPKGFRSKL
ncbi:AraC family transcriptional regulator [Croceitalea vernalis]|uniref:Helix-turn-helix transcriptional regulator n=1 Tax=Croceitalea vernalis TaxID=3075599 RepID=A0ABU3BDT9_9FLAO|nr:helix-turn-helix transcriptional regulator [Croceitalea sp. P007]MDT0620282.1 helix-turn-helix transcriptional regulator [Croceitalea sp. P007]